MWCVRYLLQSVALGTAALVGALALPSPAFAQYMGSNFHGDFGVNSGTQAGAGLYFAVPFAQWNVNDIKDADGNTVTGSSFDGFDVRALFPTMIVVTPKKLLGANYGFMVAPPFSTVRPERATLEPVEPNWGFNDMYIVPLYLGWHTPRADFVAGYGFFAPTGEYVVGGSDNVGLGMWSHEIQFGTTVYLDAAKKISLATTAYFEMHSDKKDQDLKVGNLLTLEGGAAYNLPQIGGAFGLAYSYQKKVSDDSGSDVPDLALRALNLHGRNQILGLGPDVTLGLFQKGTTAGLVNVRFLWDSAATTSFEGSTLWVAFTVAKLRP